MPIFQNVYSKNVGYSAYIILVGFTASEVIKILLRKSLKYERTLLL